MASLTLGNLLVALAVTCFIVPHGLVLGGSTGIALIVTHAVPLPLSLVVLVINAALFLLGAAFLGRSFAASTIFSTLAYPLAMSVLEALPLGQLTSEPMLAALSLAVMVSVSASAPESTASAARSSVMTFVTEAGARRSEAFFAYSTLPVRVSMSAAEGASTAISPASAAARAGKAPSSARQSSAEISLLISHLRRVLYAISLFPEGAEYVPQRLRLLCRSVSKIVAL